MISLNNLSFAFKKDEPLFSNINLELDAGSIYGLFGLNGVGKTTILHHISGILFPADGSCRVLGSPSRERKPEILSEIFLVPEQFTLPSITGHSYANVHARFYPRYDQGLLERITKEFEIDLAKIIPEMSYGQRKKFLIAFGLATQAKILLLDEPTNGLDIPSKSQFRKIIASLDHSDRCIVISTHQVRDLGAMIDHIVVLKNGTIVFDQSLEKITRTFHFKKTHSEQVKGYIYGEETLGGLNAIIAAGNGTDNSEIDIELLFNGIIIETEKVNAQF